MNLLRVCGRALGAAVIAIAVIGVGAFGVRRVPAVLFAASATVPLGPGDSLAAIPADEWLNADAPIAGADLRGDVALIEFWTFLCYNCKNVEPWMKATHARYAPQGLRVIGIHTPEFSEERRVENVRRYLDRNGITWPVGIDNSFRV